MQALIKVAHDKDVGAIIAGFYDSADVQGIGLGVHAHYVSLARASNLGPGVNQILASADTPDGWAEHCASHGYPVLSPIYIVVYVLGDPSGFASQAKLPHLQGNHAVFAEEAGPFEALADRRKHRPVEGGHSVGNDARAKGAGTVGGFVRPQPHSLHVYLMSCRHVLWDSTGGDVVQQGAHDGGTSPADSVSSSVVDVPFVPHAGFGVAAAYNRTDAAVALVTLTAASTPTRVRGVGALAGIQPAGATAIGDDVLFVGKESDRQDACIRHYMARVKITVDGTVRSFGDLLEIEPRISMMFGSLAAPGDSGAWLLSDPPLSSPEVVGMVIAASGKRAMCGVMEYALADLSGALGVGGLSLA